MLRNLALSLGEGVLGWDGHGLLFDRSKFLTSKLLKEIKHRLDCIATTSRHQLARPRPLPVAAKNLPRAPLMTSGLTWVQMHCGELRMINTFEMQKGICMYCSGMWALPCLSGLLFPSSLSIKSFFVYFPPPNYWSTNCDILDWWKKWYTTRDV